MRRELVAPGPSLCKRGQVLWGLTEGGGGRKVENIIGKKWQPREADRRRGWQKSERYYKEKMAAEGS